METQVWTPAVWSMMLAMDAVAMIDLMKHARGRRASYRMGMAAMILAVPFVGAAVYGWQRLQSVRVPAVCAALMLLATLSSCSKEELPEPYYPNTRSEQTERQHPSLPESNDNIRQRNRFVIEEQNIFNEGQVTPPTPSHQGNEGGVKPKGRSIIDQTEPNAEKE